MALEIPNLAPKVLRGPDGEYPDPSTVNAGDFYQALNVLKVYIAKNNGGAWSWDLIAGIAPGLFLTDPTFYVSPTGSDSNPGTALLPFQTMDHLLKVLAPGWFGLCTINVYGGSNTLGSKTVFPAPLGNSNTSAGGILINGLDNTDSGLGARTANGGTTGVLQTFGTVIDSAAGLTVNAWRGWFIRFTSGATLNGRSFQIASNTANTFTVVGTLPVAPTTETYVVERPAATFTWSGTEIMQGVGAVGFQNIAFVGSGGTNALRISGFVMGLQRCTITSIGSGGLQLRGGASLWDLVGIQALLGATSITQQCGSYFSGFELQFRYGGTTGPGPLEMTLSRTFFHNCDIEHSNATSIQLLADYFLGNSWVRTIYGSTALIANCRFDTVTPAPAIPSSISTAFGAAVVFSRRSSGLVSNSDISNTPATTAPGDAIFVEDLSTVDIPTCTGTGNAGFGCRVNRLSQVRKNLGTTVTGTAGDLSLGALGATAWGATVVLVTDSTELCLAGPNV